jgi:predicted Zn-dependent protease
MRRYPWAIICLLLLTAGLAGCATMYNPATGKQEFIFIPTDTEVSMGQDIHKQMAQEYSFSSDQEKLQRIQRIGQRLAQVSDRQDYEYHFYLVNDKELNAFTTPGGNIYILSGLADRLPSDDAIASVLAHEIGHCAARHTIKRFQAAVGYNLIGSILLSQVQVDDQARKLAASGSNAVMGLVFAAYSRKDEFEADLLGLKYMDLAGFDVNGMVQAFELLAREEKGPTIPLWLRTHPYITDRIAAVKVEIEKMKNRVGRSFSAEGRLKRS